MPQTMEILEASMYKAIALAQQAQWQTAPNPSVGAVLLDNDTIVAEGWHMGPDSPHAEVACLENARQKGINPSGCTLVVTLEPCNHYGKNPPCTQAILAAGIRKVVIGTLDPSAAGGGAAFLKEQGVEVVLGVAQEACHDLVSDFITWNTTELPYTIIKLASTMDGRIATRTGHSKWITCPETRHHVHALRSHVDAIIVGGNTFYQDDPKLTCRLESFLANKQQQPLGVIVTSRLPEAKGNHFLLRERPESTIFWTTVAAAASPKAEALRKRGIRVVGLSSSPKPNVRGYGFRAELTLSEGLHHLRSELGCKYVLCEGGGRLGLSLLSHNLGQELHLHLAPKILGDNEATPLFDGLAPLLMDEALQLRILEAKPSGSDLILLMRPPLPSENTLSPDNKDK